MIKDRVEKPDMSLYVKTISGKTISVKCDRRQNAKRLMEIVKRKTSIPRDQMYLVQPRNSVERQENNGRKQH